MLKVQSLYNNAAYFPNFFFMLLLWVLFNKETKNLPVKITFSLIFLYTTFCYWFSKPMHKVLSRKTRRNIWNSGVVKMKLKRNFMFEFTVEQNKCLHFNLSFYFYTRNRDREHTSTFFQGWVTFSSEWVWPTIQGSNICKLRGSWGLDIRMLISSGLYLGLTEIKEAKHGREGFAI